MSAITPQEITTRGMLKEPVWMHGVVVRLRLRVPGAPGGYSQGAASQGAASQGAAGKAAKKGKRMPKGGGAGGKPEKRECFEMHVCGGDSPADVILVETWEPVVQSRLRPLAQVGVALRFTNFLVKSHTDKTMPWTTSRLPMFAQLLPESKVETTTVDPNWQIFHPVTPVADLPYLADGSLVCLAGRVMDPAPTKISQQSKGESVAVTNFYIRVGDDVIRFAAWRDLADTPLNLEVGKIYFFEAVKKIGRSSTDKNDLELRYLTVSKQGDCPPALADDVEAKTAVDLIGARQWTKAGESKRPQRDYQLEDASWFTLSVCQAICAPSERRVLTLLAQIPSVFVSFQGKSIVYKGCGTCKRSVQDGYTCGCSQPKPTSLWKASLLLQDATAQVSATVFDALDSLVATFADGDPDRHKPESYFENPDDVQELQLCIAAVPFTLLLSFDDSDYVAGTDLIVRSAAPTFQIGKGVMHPLKPLLQFPTTSSCCPPCALADSAFNAGAGISIVNQVGVSSFRVMLELLDNPTGAKRTDDGSTMRVTRRCVCALRSTTDDSTFQLVQNGPLELTSRLLTHKKNDYMHAVVAWRKRDALTLISAHPLVASHVDSFRKFFTKEAQLHRVQMAGGKHVMDPASVAEVTPLRIQGTAMQAAQECATPGRWGRVWDFPEH